MSKRYFYLVQGFVPPEKENRRLGMWGFTVFLDREFAVKSYNFKLNDKQRGRFYSEGKRISDALGLGEGFEEHNYTFVDDRLLLHVASVPGNACGLGITGSDLSDFIEDIKMNRKAGERMDELQYTPHNVDSIEQAYGLLSLWLNWAELAKALITPVKI